MYVGWMCCLALKLVHIIIGWLDVLPGFEIGPYKLKDGWMCCLALKLVHIEDGWIDVWL